MGFSESKNFPGGGHPEYTGHVVYKPRRIPGGPHITEHGISGTSFLSEYAHLVSIQTRHITTQEKLLPGLWAVACGGGCSLGEAVGDKLHII